MNTFSTTTNSFRTAAHTGIRQKVGRKKILDLPGGLLLWRAVGKVMLWGLPVILGVNLWCASAIETQKVKSAELMLQIQQLTNGTAELEIQVDRLTSPVRVKIAAAEKLGLYEPKPEQIRRMR